MTDPASALAELMNKRDGSHPAGQPVGALEDGHLENVAAMVCELLGAKVKPRLDRKLRSWPQVIEDADDLGQLAALAFVSGYQQGRINPDPVTARHTAASVSAYLWGICNKIFVDAVRRSRRSNTIEGHDWGSWQEPVASSWPLDDLLPGGPAEDEDARLWGVLAAVQSSCQPQDILMAYLLGSGFNSGEVLRLLRVSINMPAKALKRVALALRELCGLSADSGAAAAKPQRSRRQGGQPGAAGPVTPLLLLQQKRFAELLDLLDSGTVRNLLLSQAAAALGPAQGGLEGAPALVARQFEMRAAGDWSWGLLPPDARRALLLRDAAFLLGSGLADEGAGQLAAVERLVSKLGAIYEELDKALLGDDLAWLLPLAEHLQSLLIIVSGFTELERRYGMLLAAADRLNSPRLKLLALLGLGTGHWKLGALQRAAELFREALALARKLGDPVAESNGLARLANVHWSLGEYPVALELYTQSLAVSRTATYRYGEARALSGQALIHHAQGNYALSADLQGQALALRRAIGDKHGEANSLGNLAAVHGNQGKYQSAADLYQQCQSLCRELGDRRGEAHALRGLALIQGSLGEPVKALEAHETALQIFRELADPEGESHSLRCIAITLSEQGDYEQAAKLQSQALAIAQELGDPQGQAESWHALAMLEASQGKLANARLLCGQAISVFTALGDKAKITRASALAACLLASSGRLEQAAVALQGSSTAAENLNCAFDRYESRPIEEAKALLAAAVQAGQCSEQQLSDWQSLGTALDLDQLAQYTVAALNTSADR